MESTDVSANSSDDQRAAHRIESEKSHVQTAESIHDNKMGPANSRKEQILEALASMLESSPGERITTAGLAKEVGVSEAALYRHFPSKAKIYEGLIDFVEDTVFSRIALINSSETSTANKCFQTLLLLLTFAEKNPGITRILTGDPLTGENIRLRKRVAQFFDRMETQLKQFLRESVIRDGDTPSLETQVAANLILSAAVGRICQYVRSDFANLPTLDWDKQWSVLSKGLFAH